jgi:hypothetical protein
MDNFAGTMFKATTTGGVTVRLAVPVKDPEVALIVAVPTALARAAPAELTLTIAGADELHVAVLVRFCVLPSLYVPAAVNCCVSPAAIEGLAGVTLTEARTGEVTVSIAAPCTVPEPAVIVVLPTIKPPARPAALIVATEGADELHVADAVKACVLPSLYVPVAENCSGRPAGTVPLAGVTPMDTRAAGPTVTDVLPVTP